jgi:NAD(P)-dependent dehydrogenase (short-subunit alcohol dehydrogenase family)
VIEIQRNLAALAAEGVRAEYHACDVSSASSLAEVLQAVRRRHGPISGILHGAGVEATARFERKKFELVQATLAPKHLGTLNLMQLTREDPLRCFIAFGSFNGRYGGIGQTDYAMANDLLAKHVDWFRQQRPECRSFTVHWPGWLEVGMAARPESRYMLELHQHRFISVQEGISLLLDELALGATATEIAFLDPSAIPGELIDPASLELDSFDSTFNGVRR